MAIGREEKPKMLCVPGKIASELDTLYHTDAAIAHRYCHAYSSLILTLSPGA